MNPRGPLKASVISCFMERKEKKKRKRKEKKNKMVKKSDEKEKTENQYDKSKHIIPSQTQHG